ncbi:MAG TPA: hypothetical protein VNN80_25105, partial [Polyangiaceae bacterium]|nr:hypothetical protein [Polyangiaceae bacterium]
DNFEHLLPGALLVRDLLQAAPGVRVLATSREPLGISAETRSSLEGMSVPSPGDTIALLGFSGVQLFVEAAQRVNRGFSPVGADVSHVADVCRRVEGNPLAIVLAASWVGVLAPAEIARELSHGLLLPRTEAPDVPDRRPSVHAVCERSLERLDAEQRSVFSRLAVFSGGFSRAAAEIVAGADLHTLSALVNKSLVRARPAARRYDLHELLRRCGEERLRLDADYEQTKDRHAAFYVQLLASQATELFGRGHRAARDALEVELGNVQAAWQWLLRRGALEGLEHVAAAVEEYYERRGSSADAAALFGAAVERLEVDAARHGDRGRRLLGWSRCLQAYHCQRQALLGLAREHVQRALQILNPEQDLREYGRALIMAASVARGHEQAGRVVETAERGIELLRKAGDRWLLARALAFVAPWLYEHGAHVERAEAHLRESIRLQRELAGQVVLPTSLGSFAFGRARQGYFEEGREQLREALAIATQLDDVWSIQRCLRLLAQTERSRGDYGSALALATRDLDLSQLYGAREEGSWAQLAIAEIEIDLGRLEEARERLESCPLPPATPELFLALIDLSLADIARATGRVELAQRKCESSLAAFERLDIAWAKATAHTRLGELAGARGDDMGAMAYLRAGLAFAAGARRAPLVILAAAGWAELHARAGNTRRALEISAMLAQHHATEHGTRTRRIQPLLEALRGRCTPECFDAAMERGRALSLEAFVNGLGHDLPVRG